MAYVVIRIRKRKTQAAHVAGEDEDGQRSNHIGDVVAILPDSHVFSVTECASFAIVKINGMPKKAEERLLSPAEDFGGYVPEYDPETGEPMVDVSGQVIYTTEEIWITRRPRRYRISKSALQAKFPAFTAKLVEMYSYGHVVPQEDFASVNWTQVKDVWRDKEQNGIIVTIDDTDA